MGWLASLGLHFGDIVSLGACCGVRGLLIVGVVGRALLLLLAGGRRWSVVSSCLFFFLVEWCRWLYVDEGSVIG